MLLHVYGVVAATAQLPPGLTGRGGQPVRVIGDEDLGVLASEIDDEARVRRDDLLAHAHLLEKIADSSTVIPVRFGMLMPDEDTLRREFLDNQHDRLLALLRAFDGYVQLTVQVAYDEEAALREVLHRDRDLADLREAVAADPDATAQLRLGEAVAGSLALLQQESADLVVDRLRPHVQAMVLNETRGAYDVANVALLVDRRRRQDLDTAVGDLERELDGRMTVRYVGPQPPYAFLDSVVTEEQSWA